MAEPEECPSDRVITPKPYDWEEAEKWSAFIEDHLHSFDEIQVYNPKSAVRHTHEFSGPIGRGRLSAEDNISHLGKLLTDSTIGLGYNSSYAQEYLTSLSIQTSEDASLYPVFKSFVALSLQKSLAKPTLLYVTERVTECLDDNHLAATYLGRMLGNGDFLNDWVPVSPRERSWLKRQEQRLGEIRAL